jgi:hypothetical protein
MYTLRQLWRRALAWLNAPGTGATPLTHRPSFGDEMSLQDWSDLPSHHPGRARTPC